MSSTLSPSVNEELEVDMECDRLNWSTFTILGTSCFIDFPKRDPGCLRAALRDGVPPLTGELLVRVIGRVGVRGGEGKELEDEVEDGGLGMAERLGVLGFDVLSIFFGGVAVFRGGGEGPREDSLAGGGGETLAGVLVGNAL